MPNCKTCNKLLHKDADFCPSCRDPNPFTRDTDYASIFIVLGGLAAFGLFMYLIFYATILIGISPIFWKTVGLMAVIATPFLYFRFLASKNPHIPKSAKYFVTIFSIALAVIIYAG